MNRSVDVLLISTYDSDGTGLFTSKLDSYLHEIGYTTQFICLKSRNDKSGAIGILDKRPIIRFGYRIFDEIIRRFIRPDPNYAFIHMNTVSSKYVLKSDTLPFQCKFIICTFVSGFINISTLNKLKDKYGSVPIIFYAVDMNFYTAGCHYSRECVGYTTGCNNCPAVPWFLKRNVAANFKTKQQEYCKIKPLYIVASSAQQFNQIKQSAFYSRSNVIKILMAVDETIYGKYESQRAFLKRKYSLKNNVILIRSSSEPRKGCDVFISTIKSIKNNNPDIFQNISIVCIGDQYIANSLNGLNANLYSPGYISSEDELSQIYAIADVFLMTSESDSGPVMLAQSLMSGTPVITTDVGLARDLVIPGKNGFILTKPTSIDFENAIIKIFNKSKSDMQLMRASARENSQKLMNKEKYRDNLKNLLRLIASEHSQIKS